MLFTTNPTLKFFRRNPELHGERPATRHPSDGREQSGIPTVFKWL